eukprot:TRINITY_DN12252_c2_g2_i5.p1 TRINITY_DN12252_c2_g2~~TRINITY_DN12252_c2_g2_i5.p1  ORF type:complete len:219 (+),score=35.00 TRINITY_DN12252_c2_g2_i5:190-846(+)
MRSSLLAARGAFVAAVVLFVLSALNFKRWFLINENSTSLMITVEPTDDGDNIAVMDRAVPAHLERFELQHDTGNRGVLFRMGMGDAERQRLKQLRKEAFEQQQALVFQARMQEVLKQPSPVTEDEYNAAIAVAGLPTNDKCQATHKLQEGCDHGRILPVLVTGVGRSGWRNLLAVCGGRPGCILSLGKEQSSYPSAKVCTSVSSSSASAARDCLLDNL